MGQYDWASGDGVADDPVNNGHGTLDIGIIAANTNNSVGIAGVAPNVDYYVSKVTGSSGGPPAPFANGIDWCNQNATILSISVKCSVESCPDVHDALNDTWDNGGLPFVAAGNGGSSTGPCTNCIWDPASFPPSIAVTNVGPGGVIWTGSSTGPKAELAAPGVSIRGPVASSNSAYSTKDGTSQAAPHAAGVAALVWNYAPNMTHVVLRDLLAETATDLGVPGRDETYGFGRVNAESALNEISPATLPICRLASPTRFNELAAIRPTLSGTVAFEAWVESRHSSITNVNLTFQRLLTQTLLTMNTTGDTHVYERGVNTASLTNGDYTVTVSCRESDASTRIHVRQYTISN